MAGGQAELVMTGATADEVWPLVRDFHYSERAPHAVSYGFAFREPGGLFGDTGNIRAGVLYSPPGNKHFPNDALELSRLVRADDFNAAPLSKLVAWSLRWLRANTTRPFVLSYADSAQDHHGGIYQAVGFIYIGEFGVPYNKVCGFTDAQGRFVHGRTATARYGTRKTETILERFPDWTAVEALPKHLYIFPLRQKWATIARKHGWQSFPYPKPHAARLLDAPVPPGASEAQTLGAAPDNREAA